MKNNDFVDDMKNMEIFFFNKKGSEMWMLEHKQEQPDFYSHFS